ncbi:MAG: hypothetical protein JXR86_20345 [Spirochaetales bacterium]|nr:hypothetical protein [Spirochaetales bacterium]
MLSIIHLVLVFVVLVVLNELFRLSKWFTLAAFILLPLVMSFAVWPSTTGVGTSVDTWFHWAKLYSVVVAAAGFTFMRFTSLGEKSYAKAFPPLILALNILEAVVRDFELGITAGGAWHFMNGLAGLFSILAISGWTGIFSEKKDKHDLLWLDMTKLWIIAYDVWNLSYIYFCVPEHATYGISVLLACTVPSLFIKKGTWIQARAYTLGLWMMYIMTFNRFVDTPGVTLMLPESTALKYVFAVLSLGLNGWLVLVHLKKILGEKDFRPGKVLYTA